MLGEFLLGGVLGEGGSGRVYDATWGHRRIALKVLRRELVTTEHEAARFASEAALIQSVDHPSIVKVLGSGVLPDGRPWLAMELLEGETLAARIARGSLLLADALTMFGQLMSAVEALHKRGLIHRDVKPENVMVVRGFAVLLDFGIAKDQSAAVSTVTQQGGMRGTPAYMAPERFFGAQATVASDVYELAVTLYAMLTGRLPWDSAADPAARLNPPRPSELGFALPPGLEAAIMQALSTRAEARPASVTELGHRIAAAASSPEAAPVSMDGRLTTDLGPRGHVAPIPPPPSPIVAPAQLHRRGPRMWIVAVAILAVAGIVTAVALIPSGKPTPDATTTPTAPRELTAETPSDKPAPSLDSPIAGPVTHQPAPEGWIDMALALHSKDIVLVLGVAPKQLHNTAGLKATLEKQAASPALQRWTEIVADCGFDPMDAITDLTLGVARPNANPSFEVVARGTFTRDQLEKCIGVAAAKAGAKTSLEKRGNASKIAIADHTIWLAFPDAHTVFAAMRDEASWAWLDARLKHTASLREAKATIALLDNVDLGATMWAVIGDDVAQVAPLLGVSPPDAAYISLDAKAELTFHAGLRFPSSELATAAAKAMSDRLAELEKDPAAALILGNSGFKVVGTDLLFGMRIGEAFTTMMFQALVEYTDRALK